MRLFSNVTVFSWQLTWTARWTKAGKFVFGSRPPLRLLPQLCPSSFAASGRGGINGFGSLTPTRCPARLHTVGQLPTG
jgi:hypothetical protein